SDVETTEPKPPKKKDTYDMSKTRVAFMMCVTTGRHGAEKDIEVMNKWFGKYQFETPSGESLEEFRDQINQSEDEISCCLITLMSHGRSHGLIQGKDGDTVDLDDIFALFNNIQCPKLQEKPKIFIIQACRGGEQDIKYTVLSKLIHRVRNNTLPFFTRRLCFLIIKRKGWEPKRNQGSNRQTGSWGPNRFREAPKRILS
uniref:Caspase family p20 domain-containing protein n=1 Tax=Terrapene triunguis TaxID=2587831 RepID=A0A674JD64_9SAUR